MPEKSTVTDVFCNEKFKQLVMSTGPNLLIEFEASSKKTTFGFSGMYRFTEFGNESDYDNEGIYILYCICVHCVQKF